jgi:PAS domain S-box-containing protein
MTGRDEKTIARLKAELEQVHGFLDEIDEFVVHWKADGIRTFVNRAYCSYYGTTREEAIGTSIYTPMPESDIVKVQRRIEKLSPERPQSEGEYRIIRTDGSEGWNYWKDKAIYANGELVEYHSMGMDITERKEIEEELRLSEAKLSNALNIGRLGYWELDIASGLFTFSDSFYAIFRTNTKEMGGYTMSIPDYAQRFVHPDDAHRVAEETDKAIETDDPNFSRYIEHKMFYADGTVGYIAVRFFIEKDHHGKTIRTYGVNQDITERRRTEEELLRAQKLESIGLLAGGIAHDFNNLLGGIYGYIDIAEGITTDPKLHRYLSKTLATIDRARDLTRQLITFAKGGAPVLSKGSLFPYLKDSALFACSGSNVSCTFDIAEDLWACDYDKNQICQVIDNIVINAKQSMPEGGTIKITARNTTLSEDEHPILKVGKYAIISIEDHGIGMPKEILTRIFDPFYTTKSSGHGLGLATCYSIIRQHGGLIEVDSEPGKGSTFHILLPASAGYIPNDQTYSSNLFRSGGTFLVMDDQEVMREICREMLETMGFEVICVDNGQEAIDFFAENNKSGSPIAGAIFDLTVPGGMGGREAVDRVREMGIDVPVFAASGHAQDPIIAKPLEFGFSGCITKPFRKTDLMSLLEKHLK